MARNSYIKFCDAHSLTSGVMREMLIKGNATEAKKAIKEYRSLLLEKAQACNDLFDIITAEITNMSCEKCGGNMDGDGFTVVLHCEHTDANLWDLEPDAGPIYCDYDPYDERGHQG